MLLLTVFAVLFAGSLAEDCPASAKDRTFQTGTCQGFFNYYRKSICSFEEFKRVCCYHCPNNADKYDTSRNNIIDILVVFDKTMVNRFKNVSRVTEQRAKVMMSDELEYIIDEVNGIFNSLAQNGIKIKFAIRKVVFADEDIYPASGPGIYHKNDLDFVNIGPALTDFNTWLRTNMMYTTYNPDLAVLFTQWKFFQGNDTNLRVAGVSYPRSVCRKKKYVSISIEGDYRDVTTLSHEFGHTLGGRHDDKTDCPDKMYALASRRGIAFPKRWEFSSCTANDMKDYMGTYDLHCLTQMDAESHLPSPKADLAIKDQNSVCDRTSTEKEKACRDSTVTASDAWGKMCTIMMCEDEKGACFWKIASDGMACKTSSNSATGTCRKGTCVMA